MTLHIYDVHRLVRGLNTFLKGIPGFYHTGVEVHGREWSFSSNGILECRPRHFAYHLHRENVTVGTTSLSETEVGMLLDRFHSAWVASEYHCIRRNGNDFSEAFCVALGVARPPRNSQACFCLPAKEAARRADLKCAIAARDFVEGLREAGAMSRENSSPVSTRLPSLLGSPQAGEATILAGQGLHKESPPAMSTSMQVATQLQLPLGCLQRSSPETGAEEPGDGRRTASTPSIDSRSSESSDSHPTAQLQEGKRRGRSPTVRLTCNSDWEVVRAAARSHRQMKAACVFFRNKKREDVPWPGSQDLRWMDACGSSM